MPMHFINTQEANKSRSLELALYEWVKHSIDRGSRHAKFERSHFDSNQEDCYIFSQKWSDVTCYVRQK